MYIKPKVIKKILAKMFAQHFETSGMFFDVCHLLIL